MDERTAETDPVIPLVVNGRAGRAGEVPNAAGPSYRVVETDPRGLSAALERELVAAPPMLAVAGGDGTLRTAAELLAGTPVTLIPVPAGTLNHFARRCGVATVDAALRLHRSGRTVRGSVGVADDRVFVNTLITGAYPELVGRRRRYERFLPRSLAGVVASAVTAVRARPVRVTLETGEGRSEHRTLMVWIGLGRGSFPFSHLSEPAGSRRVLEVAVLRGTRRLHALRVVARLLKSTVARGDLRDVPGIAVEQVRRIIIRSPHTIRAALDGEPFSFRSPLFIDVLPDALRVRAATEPAPDG